MSYFGNNDSSSSRPGFSEQTSDFGSSGFNDNQSGGGYGSNGNSYSQSGGNYNNGNAQGSSSSGYGNSGGYNNRNSSNSNGGGNSGWKGNGGSGGWKGGNKGGFGNKAPMTAEQLSALKFPKRAVIMAGNFGAPDALAPMVQEIINYVKQNNFTIRASVMDGFDKMVSHHAPDSEFHIPWKGFNDCNNATNSYYSEKALEFAKRYCPEWGSLKDSHQKFYAKNVTLVLGKSLEAHAHVAIIWSEDGVESPNNRGQRSAHAGHIAAMCHAAGIPVINLSNPNAVQRLRSLIEGNKQNG